MGKGWTNPARWARLLLRSMPSTCDRCTRQFPEPLGKRQDGQWLCPDCYEPGGGGTDRDLARAAASAKAAELDVRQAKSPINVRSLFAASGFVTGWWGGDTPTVSGEFNHSATDPIMFVKHGGGPPPALSTHLRLWGVGLKTGDTMSVEVPPGDPLGISIGASYANLQNPAFAADGTYVEVDLFTSQFTYLRYYDLKYNGRVYPKVFERYGA